MNDKIKFISAPYMVDRKLYKYYSNIGFAIDCIKRRRVHLDNPHDFNDPFEAKWHFSHYTLLETISPANSVFDEVFEYITALPIGNQSNYHSHILRALHCVIIVITRPALGTSQHIIHLLRPLLGNFRRCPRYSMVMQFRFLPTKYSHFSLLSKL